MTTKRGVIRANKIQMTQVLTLVTVYYHSHFLLTILHAHKWRDAIMQGVHRLNWLVPITGHKHSDYQNSEILTELKKCLLV